VADDTTTEMTDTDTDTGIGSGSGTDADAEREAEAEAHRRRTIIRLLVGFGIGIPVLIELATFVGLVEQSLLGGDGEESEANGATTRTATDDGTDESSRVGVGDELVPATDQRETLTVASFRAGDDSWVLTLAAAVENTESVPYTVQFGALTTENGERVEGTGRQVTVVDGATAQVTGTWQLSPGSRPATVVVRTTRGDETPTDHEVDLARIPLEGD
jgi:hypothetical protein